MTPAPVELESKLPNVGTTIFAVMSTMAAEQNAINLSQGYPDFPISAQLIDLVEHYMSNGHNQYAPMAGVPVLLRQIANKLNDSLDNNFDAKTEITVVAGATEGLFATITALVQKGDEVIIFDPAYDSYAPAVQLSGGSSIHLELKLPNFNSRWIELPPES